MWKVCFRSFYMLFVCYMCSGFLSTMKRTPWGLSWVGWMNMDENFNYMYGQHEVIHQHKSCWLDRPLRCGLEASKPINNIEVIHLCIDKCSIFIQRLDDFLFPGFQVSLIKGFFFGQLLFWAIANCFEPWSWWWFTLRWPFRWWGWWWDRRFRLTLH
jgi:hypothetical protein